MYQKYQAKYQMLVTRYLPRNNDPLEIVEQVLQIARQMLPCNLNSWDNSKKEFIPDILAGIFAYYTVSKCGDSWNSIGENNDNYDNNETKGEVSINVQDILLTPHSIQVLTILRLLGCGDTPTTLQNQLMQISTGEGKSIILGALATIFGILRFNVRCVCYSEYLSSRDYGDFKDIFVAFKCTQNVKYSKITQYSEDSVARQGNIREMTRNLILGKDINSTESNMLRSEMKMDNYESKLETKLDKESTYKNADNREINRNETNYETSYASSATQDILLVDEVDVFFGKDFYGQTYNQATHISTPEIISLIKKIWNERVTKPSLNTLSSSAEYHSLVSQFSQWKFLIDNEIKLMCAQVNSFDVPEPHYNKETDKIGYRDHDSISYTMSYGYRTVFAYLREFDRGTVKSEHKSKFDVTHLHMQISCGQFSYGDINPACILGVSGTIDALTPYEQEVMSRYKIHQYSLAPSVYNKSKATFDSAGRGIYIADDKTDFFQNISLQINEYSCTSDASKKKHRSIIVIFESYDRLMEYKRSEYFRQVTFKGSVNELCENTPKDDRDYAIKKAATAGQVTFATRAFGRGTDFISRDSVLDSRGGTHILQTFYSDMYSEEIQIKGRTARQGQKGSYSMILLLRDDPIIENDKPIPKVDTLEYFGIQSKND
jgi:hypothetical protein